jgi:hypothetical protein
MYKPFTPYIVLLTIAIVIVILVYIIFSNKWTLRTTRGRVVYGLALASFIWLTSLDLALYLLGLLINNSQYISYSASSLEQFTGAILAFIGVVLGLMIAVFTSINTQSRDHRISGFHIFRESVENLENISLKLRKEYYYPREEITAFGSADRGLDFIQKSMWTKTWIDHLGLLTSHLNQITMNWIGWKHDTSLEKDLLYNVWISKFCSKMTEQNVHENLDFYKQNIRRLLFGLHSLDEAKLGDTLLLRLSSVLGSLTTLIGTGLVFHLLSGLDTGLTFSSTVLLFDALFLSINLFLHLWFIILAISAWWDQVRKRDDAWISSSNGTLTE